jgi:hypothetical protein
MIDACRQAEPKDLLQKRYQQFQRRLARHYINMSTTEQEGGATEEEGPSQLENKTRVALQRVGGASGQGENQQQGLTRRPSGHSSSSRTKQSSSSSSGVGVGAGGSSGNFMVFQEDASEVKRRNGDVALSDAAGAAWESFAPEKVKTKENDGKKQKHH